MAAHPMIAEIRLPPSLRPDAVATLLAALRRAEADPGCRALVLGAEGPVFCSGVDLDRLSRWTAEDNAALWELLRGLTNSRLVTVAVVDGAASGGGVGLAAACDLVVAGPAAEFRLTELLLGLVPALIMPFVAARTGHQALFRSAVLASRLDAAAAGRLGLADEVVDRPEQSIHRLALALRRMPRDAVADLKSCRRLLAPAPDGYPEHAHALLQSAIADPAVQARLGALPGARS